MLLLLAEASISGTKASSRLRISAGMVLCCFFVENGELVLCFELQSLEIFEVEVVICSDRKRNGKEIMSIYDLLAAVSQSCFVADNEER